MNAIEQHALAKQEKQQSTVLLLHVEPENEAALGFYKALGYGIVTAAEDSLKGLDVDQLAVNAEVKDQLLLNKALLEDAAPSAPKKSNKNKKKKASRGGGGGKGFGG